MILNARSAGTIPRWRPVDPGAAVLLALSIAYILVFCVLPLGRLFAEAIVPGGRLDGSVISDTLAARSTARATWHTIEAGLGATLVSVVLGGVMALLVGLTDIRAKTPLVFLLILPILIPAQITAIAWLQLFGPSSPILEPLGLAPPPGRGNPLHSREGIILLMGIEHSVMVFLAMRAGLRGVPPDLIEAARAAGARPLTIVWTVVLPMMRPALLAGAALAFVSAIGNFGIPALLGIPGRYTMLTTLIYQRLNGFGPSVLGQVAVLAFILAALAATGLAVQALASRGDRNRLSGTGAPVPPFALGRWRLPVEAAAWARGPRSPTASVTRRTEPSGWKLPTTVTSTASACVTFAVST